MKRLSLISLFRYYSDSHGHGILISQLGDPCQNIVAYLCGYSHIYGRPGPMVRMPIAEISQMELKYYIILAVEAMH